MEGCAFSTSSTFMPAGPYFSTSGEKSGSARTEGSAAGTVGIEAGGAIACDWLVDDWGRDPWALESPEHAASAMEIHNTGHSGCADGGRNCEEASGAGRRRDTLMLDSESL